MKEMSLSQKIVYAPVGAALAVLSSLPLSVLYVFADLLAFIAHRVVKYRLKLLRRNLADCFADKSDDELKHMERDFYHWLADYFVETVRYRKMPDREVMRRMRFENVELIDSLVAEGKSPVVYTSHFGNWEWITSIGLWSNQPDAQFAQIYRPLKNKWFDRWFLSLRGRYSVSIPMHSTLRRLIRWRKEGVQTVTGFLSDQKPSHDSTVVNVSFMGRETPFIAGTEELARKFDSPVLYLDTRREGRGRYVTEVKMIEEHPSAVEFGSITAQYASMLEKTIRRTPYAYLWTHNRWRINLKQLNHE